jgi:hypothetical protein
VRFIVSHIRQKRADVGHLPDIRAGYSFLGPRSKYLCGFYGIFISILIAELAGQPKILG